MLQITVSDPVKLGEGMHAYISYKINTKTDDPAYDYNSPSPIPQYPWCHVGAIQAIV